MAYVQNFNGKSRTVLNLGWLRRHWKDVEYFDLAEVGRSPHGEGLMVAHLRGGGRYLSHWGSFAVMLDWVRRPVFRGLPAFRCLLTVSVEPDDIPVRGNALASGDAAVDRAAEDDILRRLADGDVWAWCNVMVKAERGEAEGRDLLGACSYADERDFCRGLDGYFGDMAQAAISACRVASDLGALEPIK